MIIPILAASGTDQMEHWSFVATIFGAIWAAVWAVKQWRDEKAKRRGEQADEREARAREREARHTELRQRQQELRWKQAELARTMMDAIFDYDPSNDAWRMVDGEEDGYKDQGGNKHRIDMALSGEPCQRRGARSAVGRRFMCVGVLMRCFLPRTNRTRHTTQDFALRRCESLCRLLCGIDG
jgi:hypothetical protein